MRSSKVLKTKLNDGNNSCNCCSAIEMVYWKLCQRKVDRHWNRNQNHWRFQRFVVQTYVWSMRQASHFVPRNEDLQSGLTSVRSCLLSHQYRRPSQFFSQLLSLKNSQLVRPRALPRQLWIRQHHWSQPDPHRPVKGQCVIVHQSIARRDTLSLLKGRESVTWQQLRIGCPNRKYLLNLS